MTHSRIQSLWGTGSTGDGLNHSYLLEISGGVRFLLQCVYVQLIVFLFDRL